MNPKSQVLTIQLELCNQLYNTVFFIEINSYPYCFISLSAHRKATVISLLNCYKTVIAKAVLNTIAKICVNCFHSEILVIDI